MSNAAYAHKWRQVNPKLEAFYNQRGNAKKRGIAWDLTFEEWLDWWGEDYARRGKGKGKLCMSRYGDTGPYTLGNIYKSEYGQNVREARLREIPNE